MVVSTIKLAEDSAIGLHRAAQGLGSAVSAVNPLCIIESSLETGSCLSYSSYYASWIPSKLHVYHIVAISPVIPVALAIFGIIAGTLKAAKEGLSVVRQALFLKIFDRHVWTPKKMEQVLTEVITKLNAPHAETRECFTRTLPQAFQDAIKGQDLQAIVDQVRAGNLETIFKARDLLSTWTGREIRDALEEIKNLTTPELERALPEWLFDDITIKGGKTYLNNLVKKVYQCDPEATAEATELLKTMKSYARKKTVVHVLQMIGAIVGVISCVGLIVLFPLPAACALLLLTGLFAISAYLVRKGIVENPNGGFSFRLCLPEFLQKAQPSVIPVRVPRKPVAQRIPTYLMLSPETIGLNFQRGQRSF